MQPYLPPWSPDAKSDRAPLESAWGTYEGGKGVVLARTSQGEVDFSAFTYLRYLNQRMLDDSYTDAFGRTKDLDIRDDLQLQKVMLFFKGWLFDPTSATSSIPGPPTPARDRARRLSWRAI